MSEIKLKLSVDEVNLVLEALGNMPYVRVYELVNKLKEQAYIQLNESPTDGNTLEADNHDR